MAAVPGQTEDLPPIEEDVQDAEAEEQGEGGEPSGSQQAYHGMADFLRNRFDECVTDRYLAEREWLASLEMYLGNYSDDGGIWDRTRQELDTLGGSRAFIRLTRSKVRSTDARMMDVLFPSGHERNWSIMSTPKPDLPASVKNRLAQELIQAKLAELQAAMSQIPEAARQEAMDAGEWPDIEAIAAQLEQGQVPKQLQPSKKDMESAIKKEADRRAEAMGTAIEDQLTDGSHGSRFRREIKKVIHSGNLYGTGWLKGPLTEVATKSVWHMTGDGWQVERNAVNRPYFEFVPVWDLYPDSIDASDMKELDGMFQRYVMTRAQVRGLKRRPYFRGEVIEQYLLEHREGDIKQMRHYEDRLRMLKKEDQGTLNRARGRRYEVVEWTGYADAEMLIRMGMAADDLGEASAAEFRANIWFIGQEVIKATLSPYDDDTIEVYHRYVFEESDTGILGIGIPEIFRDPQQLFNAVIRGIINNMGRASGPVWEINVDLLDPGEIDSIRQLYANRVILRKGRGQEGSIPAIRQYESNSHVSEFLTIANLALDLGDESTGLPRYTSGNEKVRGAAKTASGLSMLLTQANITLKEPISNYDEGVTKPFIAALYHWNMQFNEDDDIKGDFDVAATGSSSLIAKEVYSQSLESFAQNTTNPVDAAWIKRGNLNRERAKAHELDPDKLVLSDEEKAEQDRQIQEAQQKAALKQQAQQKAPAQAGNAEAG